MIFLRGCEWDWARQDGGRPRSLRSNDVVRSTVNSPAINKHSVHYKILMYGSVARISGFRCKLDSL
jgi:hypothetical protein